MTGPKIQSQVIRRVEAHYNRSVTAHLKAGLKPEQAHERALKEALRLLAEALEVLRARGLFPFPLGEVPVTPKPTGGGHAPAAD